MGIEELDKALQHCYDSQPKIIRAVELAIVIFGNEEHNNIEMCRAIIHKLEKDDYVFQKSFGLPSQNKFGYTISFEGILFYEAGGYKEAIRIERIKIDAAERSERVTSKNEKRLVRGTWAVAGGAIALVLWEMYKTFCLDKP